MPTSTQAEPAAPLRARSHAPPGRVTRVRVAAMELTRARLSGLVVGTTLAGYLVASVGRPPDPSRLAWTLLGTALAAAGASALNQWMEHTRDAVMRRTMDRPIPSGELPRAYALAIGAAMAVAGLLALALGVNRLTALLALLVEALYLLVYTPMKTRTPFCTMVGAVAGAIPPVMGWSAATGGLSLGGWILGGLLYLWQVPHFLALAWLYREDYERAGFRMLPVVDSSGRTTTEALLASTFALIPLSLAAALSGMAGSAFAVGSLLLGLGLALAGIRLHRHRSRANARTLFLASLVYLPLLLGLLVADRRSL